MQSSHKVISVGTSEKQLVPANPDRIWLSLQNDHATNLVYFKLGISPVATNQGIRLPAAGGYAEFNLSNPWPGEIYAIANAASTNVLVSEVSR